MGWYEKAAKQGNPKAQWRLGILFKNGLGVEQCNSSALRWLAKAAAHGLETAQQTIDLLLLEARNQQEMGPLVV